MGVSDGRLGGLHRNQGKLAIFIPIIWRGCHGALASEASGRDPNRAFTGLAHFFLLIHRSPVMWWSPEWSLYRRSHC